jgi:hypothetical protein
VLRAVLRRDLTSARTLKRPDVLVNEARFAIVSEFNKYFHGSSCLRQPESEAGLDDADLNGGIDRFVQIALSKNLTLNVANHATGHHGFDVQDDNERSREIIRQTIQFIKTHS